MCKLSSRTESFCRSWRAFKSLQFSVRTELRGGRKKAQRWDRDPHYYCSGGRFVYWGAFCLLLSVCSAVFFAPPDSAEAATDNQIWKFQPLIKVICLWIRLYWLCCIFLITIKNWLIWVINSVIRLFFIAIDLIFYCNRYRKRLWLICLTGWWNCDETMGWWNHKQFYLDKVELKVMVFHPARNYY